MVLKDIQMPIDFATIDDVTYKTVSDCDDGCNGCAGQGYHQLCDEFMDITDCFEDRIIWIKAEDSMSIKKDVDEWVAAGMPESTEQVAGTKYDSGKLQYSLVPPHALAEVARNLTAGLEKYKQRNNWQLVPNAEQRYLDALYRHLEAHRRGEIYDTDSTTPNMPHMAAVAVNAMFLLEFMLNPSLKKG
jgi:hypothetical protein